MVTEDSCYNRTMASLKVQRVIPSVLVSSYFTTFCYVTIRMTAVESPPTVFVIIAVVAFNSSKVLMSTTHKKNWLIKCIHIGGPGTCLGTI